jgi:multicomponent Na+:H+ antiporter subunit G
MSAPMMTIAVEALACLLIVGGAAFTLIGAIGLVRMPDVFTRMHASSVTETLGIGLIFIGYMLLSGLTLVSAKLLFLLALYFFVSPVVTHALAQAALHAGIKPQLHEDRTARDLGAPPVRGKD